MHSTADPSGRADYGVSLRVLIPPGTCMFVSYECCVLCSRDLWVGLITNPEETYRVRCAWVWWWSLVRGGPGLGRSATGNTREYYKILQTQTTFISIPKLQQFLFSPLTTESIFDSGLLCWFNPLKSKRLCNIYRYLVGTSQRAQCFH